MLNEILHKVETYVTKPNRIIGFAEALVDKILPHNFALAGPCPSSCPCSTNCKVQQPRYVLHGSYAICICQETTIGCQPC